MQTILHDGDEFFVRQKSVTVLIEYRKHRVDDVIGQRQSGADFNRSRELIYK